MMILYIVYVITNSMYARLVYLLARTIQIPNPPNETFKSISISVHRSSK